MFAFPIMAQEQTYFEDFVDYDIEHFEAIDTIDLFTAEYLLHRDKFEFTNVEIPPSEASLNQVKEKLIAMNEGCLENSNSQVKTNEKFVEEELKKFSREKEMKELLSKINGEINTYSRLCENKIEYLGLVKNLDKNILSFTAVQDSLNAESGELFTCDEDYARSLSNLYRQFSKNLTKSQRYKSSTLSKYQGAKRDLSEVQASINNELDINSSLAERQSVLLDELTFFDIKKLAYTLQLNRDESEVSAAYDPVYSDLILSTNQLVLLLGEETNFLALSFDAGSNWLITNSQEDLLKLVERLKINTEKIRNVQSASDVYDDTLNEFSKVTSEYLANSTLITSTNSIIRINSEVISNRQQEQKSYFERKNNLQKSTYNALLRDREYQQKKLLFEEALAKCGEFALSEFENVSNRKENLNEDFITAADVEFKDQASKNDQRTANSPETFVRSDLPRIFTVTSSYNEIITQFESCSGFDELKVLVNKEQIKSEKIYGVAAIKLDLEEESLPEVFTPLNFELGEISQSFEVANPPFDVYQERVKDRIAEIESQGIVDIKDTPSQNSQILLNQVWNQKLSTYDNTYNIYTCDGQNWQYNRTENELSVERQECDFENDSINFKFDQNSTISDSLDKGLEKAQTTAKLNMIGKCETTLKK